MAALLEARGIRMEFPGVLALDDVSAALHAGEVLAIVGENGAGKSTLMKVLAGLYQPNAGGLYLEGKPVTFPDTQTAMAAGVSLIHQELNLAENLSVAANITLGREVTHFGFLLDDRAARPRVEAALAKVGLPATIASKSVSCLAQGQKQLVEIARALAMNAGVIIMDEPTSSLTQNETDCLYEVIDDLKRQRIAVAYISHRLAEVKRVADRALVLRDGRNAGELPRDEVNHDNLIRKMVGREMKSLYPRTRADVPHNTPMLALDHIRYRGGPTMPVSIRVFPGEVLGMAGLVGAGRTELAEAVFGLRPIEQGSVTVNGVAISIVDPYSALEAGIAMVPEDRRAHGLLLPEGAGFNVSLPNLDSLNRCGLVDSRKANALSTGWVNRLRIRTPSLGQPVGLLSGGNQQKVVFAKWLARNPKVLILDEPTRGVDVGARGEIYAIIDDLAAKGLAVWMITSDMEELLGISDRIAVLHEGNVAGVLPRSEATEERIMRLATGGLR